METLISLGAVVISLLSLMHALRISRRKAGKEEVNELRTRLENCERERVVDRERFAQETEKFEQQTALLQRENIELMRRLVRLEGA